MSETTREINKITGTIISVSIKLILYALVILLLYKGAVIGYEFGYEIFNPTAVAALPGVDKKVTIPEQSVAKTATLLKTAGLIHDETIFQIQAKFYDYEITSGTYTINTSMNSREILELLNEAENSAEEKDTKS